MFVSPCREGFDQRKAELFINNRRFEELCGAESAEGAPPASPASPSPFVVAENFRQVNQARNSGFTYDYMLISKFEPTEEGKVRVTETAAVFALPQDALYFEALDKAIALFTYNYTAVKA